jgi:uncharacterized surface protein with fasciclin (FAS1) repeats
MYDFGGQGTMGANCMPNIIDMARTNPDLTLAVILIDRAGLTAIFNCAGPFTVQLPTNEAIEKVNKSLLAFLMMPQNKDQLRNLLLYHVLPGFYPTSVLKPGPVATLSQGKTVLVSLNPTKFNTANVTTADIVACNGLINIIDGLLTFPTGTLQCQAFDFYLIHRCYIF